MGGRDLENNTMEVMRRDTLEKETITCEGIEAYVQNLSLIHILHKGKK